ncbi:MAG: hypothetical protein R2778_16085 [Saprospiraceae bacterium]
MTKMIRKVILLLPLFFLALAWNSTAQTSSKSKSKERFRERDDRRYPVRLDNASILNLPEQITPAYYDNGIILVTARAKRGPRDERTNEPFKEHFFGCTWKIPPRSLNLMPKKSSFTRGSASPAILKPFICRETTTKTGLYRREDKDGRSTQKIYKAYYGFPDWTRPKNFHLIATTIPVCTQA